MKNTFGNNVSVTVFGESHGKSVGAVLDGMAPGVKVDEELIRHMLSFRRGDGEISTRRREKDEFVIHSGVFEGKTTGTPICITVPNEDIIASDYDEMRFCARPGHADYTAYVKYNGCNDFHGGGHFSGRVTAGLVAVGAIAVSALKEKNIHIGTHISEICGVKDRAFGDIAADISALAERRFAVLEKSAENGMKQKILSANRQGDSVGGILETAVTGFPAGVGEPWFDSIEGMLSHAVFSIPAVKGIEFGAGFGFSGITGSEANDAFIAKNGKISTKTNNNGGINGGISNGMPIVFRTVIKPTPTISKPQETVDFKENKNITLAASGRHDPCILPRARVVVDSLTAITLCDLLSQKYGTDGLL